ncbi:MAG: S-layer homology domain-containing protein [bacterium]|nr:S-layer homology domain-containing protein [bacterium]
MRYSDNVAWAMKWLRHRGTALGLLVVATILFFAGFVVANDEYQADPLGLIPGYDLTTHYSLGDDLWEVWVCDSPDGDLDISAPGLVEVLKSELVPYFDWLSGGRYRPVFNAGDPGVIAATGFTPCLDAIADHVESATEGVVTIADQETTFARGDPGGLVRYRSGELEWLALRGTSFPDNGRSVNAGGNLFSAPSDQAEGATPPQISIIAHEFGHALWFPHSYRIDPGEYDNPMDIMSDAEAAPGLQIGTIAINRYAAGWIDQDEVEVYPGEGKSRYVLAPPGDDGTQMLVLRSSEGGFMTLGARVRKGYDTGLPKEGVESYFIDTVTPHCGQGDLPPCFGLSRPTRAVHNPTVPLDFDDELAHVMGVGDGFTTWNNVSVTVVERSGDDFIVEVTDGSVQEAPEDRFSDDDGNVHEANIEVIAELGITRGCGEGLYCPSRSVKRAEMAAFLIRALGETPQEVVAASRFSDVPSGIWYVGHVERLADLGITNVESGSAFRPDDALTRLEMAVWMSRAFDFINEVTPEGVFTDVPAAEWYAGAAEGLLAAGVTRGCSADPLAYCPHDPVRRDQMASFIARALTNQPRP